MEYELSNRYFFNKKRIEDTMGLDKRRFFESIQKELESLGFVEGVNFCLNDKNSDNLLCFFEEGEFWVVAYIERDVRFSPAFFVDPKDAQIFLKSKLISEKRRN